ncbi:NUDIX domain-containing protein [Acinetobacter sp. ANC 4635]|uniref:NUDIX hydrolase n=1 Tax=Acinetobacter sp. ANC 4635 TaxID=2529846 RepID=UPI00103F8F0E|nr:NUDIX domain-containing protein [Acinetobacter sp. ANC 4635]TCB33269.1 NUDIX domain-containing protein [Acinetobacter sp. ANC 4635]
MSSSLQPIIMVAAAIIFNTQGQALLARKRHTEFFMQVGGKLEANESAQQGLLREIQEEIGVAARIVKDLGMVETAAANEANHRLLAHLFHVELLGEAQVSAELAEIQWVNVFAPIDLALAPLTEQYILPYIRQQCAESQN